MSPSSRTSPSGNDDSTPAYPPTMRAKTDTQPAARAEMNLHQQEMGVERLRGGCNSCVSVRPRKPVRQLCSLFFSNHRLLLGVCTLLLQLWLSLLLIAREPHRGVPPCNLVADLCILHGHDAPITVCDSFLGPPGWIEEGSGGMAYWLVVNRVG